MKKSLLYILLWLSVLLAACYPGDDEFGFLIEVTTEDVQDADIGFHVATVRGNYQFISGSAEISEVGFCWKDSYSIEPTIEDNTILAEKTTDGVYAAQLTDYLTSGGSYSVRAYVKVGEQCIYGEVKRFSTLYANTYKPTTGDVKVSDVQATSAHLSAEVSAPEKYPVAEAGFEYRTDSDASYTRVKGVYEEGTVSLDLTGLTSETLYYVRAYAVNAAGESRSAHSNVYYFRTGKIKPVFSEVKAENVLSTTADLTAEVYPYDALHPILEAGIQYYNSPLPDNVSYGRLVKGALAGDKVTLSVTGLVKGSTYQVRAYAKTASDTFYGPVSPFQTCGDEVLPLVFHEGIVVLREDGPNVGEIKLKGLVESRNEHFPITKVGFVYKNTSSTSIDMNTDGADSRDGVLSGNSFSVNLDLSPSTTPYLVRAFAMSGTHIVYETKAFRVYTALSKYTPQLDAFIYTKTSGTTGVKVDLQCVVMETYGYEVTERGFVYSTNSSAPTVDTNEGIVTLTGDEPFKASLNLSLPSAGSKSYYIRAYAKKRQGVSYSEVETMTLHWND